MVSKAAFEESGLSAPPRSKSKAILDEWVAPAGIRFNGPNPWDIRVHDPRFYDRVLSQGSLGFGESYMDGWWDCPELDQLMDRVLRHGLYTLRPSSWRIMLEVLRLRVLNLHSTEQSRRVAEVHYDLSNELFARMLGPTMTYSCAYWERAKSLDEAQDHKHDLICDKIRLERRHRLLDIGCGWGSFLAHAYKRTGCAGHGVTISEPQWRYARQAHEHLDVSLVDYRDPSIDARGPFDRIVSVGMFEHVGKRNHRAFFARVAKLLADDGILLLHTIGNKGRGGANPWILRYIFPNSLAPCVRDIAEGLDEFFVLEDWHSFGHDYDKTLMEWARSFERYAASPEFPFDRRFYRMWRFYLYSFAGSFRAKNYLQLWQIVASKKGVRGGYRSIR
jgi:cyclopropane-fatty-acyl-phospholipid synthase